MPGPKSLDKSQLHGLEQEQQALNLDESQLEAAKNVLETDSIELLNAQERANTIINLKTLETDDPDVSSMIAKLKYSLPSLKDGATVMPGSKNIYESLPDGISTSIQGDKLTISSGADAGYIDISNISTLAKEVDNGFNSMKIAALKIGETDYKVSLTPNGDKIDLVITHDGQEFGQQDDDNITTPEVPAEEVVSTPEAPTNLVGAKSATINDKGSERTDAGNDKVITPKGTDGSGLNLDDNDTVSLPEAVVAAKATETIDGITYDIDRSDAAGLSKTDLYITTITDSDGKDTAQIVSDTNDIAYDTQGPTKGTLTIEDKSYDVSYTMDNNTISLHATQVNEEVTSENAPNSRGTLKTSTESRETKSYTGDNLLGIDEQKMDHYQNEVRKSINNDIDKDSNNAVNAIKTKSKIYENLDLINYKGLQIVEEDPQFAGVLDDLFGSDFFSSGVDADQAQINLEDLIGEYTTSGDNCEDCTKLYEIVMSLTNVIEDNWNFSGDTYNKYVHPLNSYKEAFVTPIKSITADEATFWNAIQANQEMKNAETLTPAIGSSENTPDRYYQKLSPRNTTDALSNIQYTESAPQLTKLISEFTMTHTAIELKAEKDKEGKNIQGTGELVYFNNAYLNEVGYDSGNPGTVDEILLADHLYDNGNSISINDLVDTIYANENSTILTKYDIRDDSDTDQETFLNNIEQPNEEVVFKEGILFGENGIDTVLNKVPKLKDSPEGVSKAKDKLTKENPDYTISGKTISPALSEINQNIHILKIQTGDDIQYISRKDFVNSMKPFDDAVGKKMSKRIARSETTENQKLSLDHAKLFQQKYGIDDAFLNTQELELNTDKNNTESLTLQSTNKETKWNKVGILLKKDNNSLQSPSIGKDFASSKIKLEGLGKEAVQKVIKNAIIMQSMYGSQFTKWQRESTTERLKGQLSVSLPVLSTHKDALITGDRGVLGDKKITIAGKEIDADSDLTIKDFKIENGLITYIPTNDVE